MLTRDAILGSRDLNVTAVEVPEWGGTVHLRALTLAEMQEVEAKQAEAKGAAFVALVVAYGLCDAEGTRLFTSDEDIAGLLAKSARVLRRLTRRCMAVNQLTQADVEDIAGNSDAGPSAPTASSSPNG